MHFERVGTDMELGNVDILVADTVVAPDVELGAEPDVVAEALDAAVVEPDVVAEALDVAVAEPDVVAEALDVVVAEPDAVVAVRGVEAVELDVRRPEVVVRVVRRLVLVLVPVHMLLK